MPRTMSDGGIMVVGRTQPARQTISKAATQNMTAASRCARTRRGAAGVTFAYLR